MMSAKFHVFFLYLNCDKGKSEPWLRSSNNLVIIIDSFELKPYKPESQIIK